MACSFLRLMALVSPSASSHSHYLKMAPTVALVILFLVTFLPPKSVGSVESGDGHEERKMVLGSRPPRCVNKCLSCRPCTATLVVPSPPDHHHNHPQQKMKSFGGQARGGDDTYYLLSWKCRCGNQLFHP